MRLPLFQIDAFTDRVFRGNPAAVVPLERWLPEALMQAIAAENNLSETAFFVPEGDGYALRWFTPRVEVDLCGHATLASAHLILTRLAPGAARVRFTTRSGPLEVTRDGEWMVLDLPALPATPVPAPAALTRALGRDPAETLAVPGRYLAVFASPDDVAGLRPDMALLAALDRPGVIVSAPGRDCDYVSRYFAPAKGVPEDPVTGTAHCALVPYWSRRLDRRRLAARQLSERGGDLACEHVGDRVRLGGQAALYLEGSIEI